MIAHLPIEKVCIIKNSEEENFNDFKTRRDLDN